MIVYIIYKVQGSFNHAISMTKTEKEAFSFANFMNKEYDGDNNKATYFIEQTELNDDILELDYE